MRKIEKVLFYMLKRFPFNLITLCLLVWLLYPVDRLTDANLTQLRIGMPMLEVISIFGTPITEQGYRVGVMRGGCFGFSVDFESDREGLHAPGGDYRTGYAIVPSSSWSTVYVINEVPLNRPSAIKNPDLKVWAGRERSLWIWSDKQEMVTHVLELPVRLAGGVA